MKNSKKLVSLILSLLMVFSSIISLSATVSAADSEQPYEKLTFHARDKYGTITVENPEGASYDSESNTLKLTDFKHPELWLELTGCNQVFTLTIIGECELDYLSFPRAEADILINGTGTLTVNQNKYHDSAIYAYNQNPYSNFTVRFSKDVKLHLYGNDYGLASDSVALLSGYTGGIVFENGQTYNDYTASIREYDTEEYVNLFHYYEDNVRRHGYQLTCASDPTGIYAVRINDYADPPTYNISKYYTIEGCDGYGQIDTFGEYGSLQMSQEEFLNSDYSFIYEDEYARIRCVSQDWREWAGNKLVNTENPLDPKKGTYCASLCDFYYDENNQLVPISYNILLLTWSEEENVYILDWDAMQNPVEFNMSVEEFNESPYYFDTGFYTGESSLQKEYSSDSAIICLKNEQDAEKFAWSGYKVTNMNHPEQIYTCDFDYEEYYDDSHFTVKGYNLYPLTYDEQISCYRWDYDSIQLTKEEFEQQGYQVAVEPTKKKELESKNSWGLSGAKLYVDREGNRYVEDKQWVNGEWITGYCPISDDRTVFIPSEYINMFTGSETYYIPGDIADIDPNELSPVTKHIVTDQWVCMIMGTEFFYNFDEENPVVIGDADGDGQITVKDVTEVQHYLSNMATQADQETLMFADVDNNGRLEVIDTTWLQRHLTGMPIPYEIG